MRASPLSRFTIFLLGFLFLFTLLSAACANVAETSATNDDDDDVDLNDLTDAELEAICTDRGFELVREIDEATGELREYTHEDYVDAASQCLAIEEEVEQLLEEHPELLEEVKQESERMVAEKEELEKEISEAQSDVGTDRENEDIEGHKAFVDAFFESNAMDEDENDAGESMGETGGAEEITEGTDETVSEEGESDLTEDDAVIDLDLEDEGNAQDDSSEKSPSGTSSEGGNSDTELRNKDPAGESQARNESLTGVATSSGDDSRGGIDPKGMVALLRDKVVARIENVVESLIPEPIRETIQSALKPIVRASKNAGITTYRMMKRYLAAFVASARSRREGEKSLSNDLAKDEDALASRGENTRILDLREIVGEFRDKVKEHGRMVVDSLIPEPIQQKLQTALKPVARVGKKVGIASYRTLKKCVAELTAAAARRREGRDEKQEPASKEAQ